MKTKLSAMAIVLGAASLLAGCSSDYTVEFNYLSNPPTGSDISVEFDQVRLQDGVAVAVLARPFRNESKMDWETNLELQTSNPGIFDLERLEFDVDREERKDDDLRDGDWRYMLWGRAVGSSNIEVWIDGELEAEIPVFVNPQPEG